MNGPARAALAGLATGGRMMTGLAALTLATPPRPTSQPDATLARPWAKVIATGLALQEDVLDKLPKTPSRLQPVGLILRAVTGAGVGYIVAERTKPASHPTPAPVEGVDSEPEVVAHTIINTARDTRVRPLLYVVTGVAGAVAGSYAGAAWRAWAAPRFGNDYVGAGLEDAVVTGLAFLAAR